MSIAHNSKLDSNYMRLRELLDAGLLIEDEKFIELLEDLQVVGTSAGAAREDKYFLPSIFFEENDVPDVPEMKERVKLLKACLVENRAALFPSSSPSSFQKEKDKSCKEQLMPGVVRYLPTEEGKSECKPENLRSKSEENFKVEQNKNFEFFKPNVAENLIEKDDLKQKVSTEKDNLRKLPKQVSINSGVRKPSTPYRPKTSYASKRECTSDKTMSLPTIAKPGVSKLGESKKTLSEKLLYGNLKYFQNRKKGKNRKSTKKKNVEIDEENSDDWNSEKIQKIQKSIVVKFDDFPDKKPLRLCFDYPGIDLTHTDIKRAIVKVDENAFTDKLVTALKFENRRIKHHSNDLTNRWHIEFVDLSTRNHFIEKGLVFISAKSKKKINVELKKYDNVTAEEYKRYLKSIDANEELHRFTLLNPNYQ